jgi:hypothetical protein
MRSLSLVLIAAVATILIVGAVLKGEAAKLGVSDEVRNQRALSMLRRINTMEAEAFGTKKAYVAADELLHPNFDIKVDSVFVTTPDRTLLLVISKDQKHYQAALLGNDKVCAQDYFSNESGIIYAGKALGCE